MTLAKVSDTIGVVSLPSESKSVAKIPNSNVTTEQDLEKRCNVWQTKVGVLVALIDKLGTDELREKAVKAIGFEDWDKAEQAFRSAVMKTDFFSFAIGDEMLLEVTHSDADGGHRFRKVCVESTRPMVRVRYARDVNAGSTEVFLIDPGELRLRGQIPEGATVEE